MCERGGNDEGWYFPSDEVLMAITYEDAVAKVQEWTDNPALRNHARGVEEAMRRAAHRYGACAEDEPQCAIAGLLHDADYDRWPEEHPRRIVAWVGRLEPAVDCLSSPFIACHRGP
jgi:predicted hydrolase (HD superfamily)